ncbi:MAG: hypothetical protein CL678_12645 [Bdellovibrionaceae bacterium]|nr:hypothetical protein [Pseudobdellovibrionaceae bacterium]|tara:strand:- start:1710 stop:2423 length:714 start_codon:yes stop_codon:yes gene_type:complete
MKLFSIYIFSLLLTHPIKAETFSTEARLGIPAFLQSKSDPSKISNDYLPYLNNGRIFTSPIEHPYKRTIAIEGYTIMRLPLKEVFETGVNFDQFAEMGMPGVTKSVIVTHSSYESPGLAWFEMRQFGFASRHYVEFQLKKKHDSAHSSWTLSNPDSLSYHSKYGYLANKPKIQGLFGSWYVKSLDPDKNGNPRTFVRYFIKTQFKKIVPGFIINRIFKKNLPDDVKTIIKNIENAAR